LSGYYNNEAEVRSEFTHILKNYLEDDPKLDGIKLNEDVTIIEGKPDARIGKFIIEFQSPIRRKKIIKEVSDAYIEKTQRYIDSFRKSGFSARAIITNGIELVFLDEEGKVVDRGFLCET
jgi:hypothetical protein